MHIEGRILANIFCTREAEIRNRNSVQYGSVRVGIERVINNTGDIIRPITKGPDKLTHKLILEISYKINTPDEHKYYLIHDLVAGDQVNIKINQGLYIKESHKMIVRRKICSVYVKILGNEQNIPSLEHIERFNQSNMNMTSLDLAAAMLNDFKKPEEKIA